ncbi:MAG TPA: undecaprenyldiphospho-muramoylpentapeptide beta-N-acetylglucosaminyltransferase [Saprospiraceae bacterium]|nr:undecaprenyldiphospho-muramoylpentapeptide beta-N-acetylglucosaminyltransferase [Saprospiraceae bacterium]
MKVIISGGGTGGHVYPAIAIADALKKRDPLIDILFVGAKGRMEMEKVPAAGYPIKGLWISGFQRRLTMANLSFPLKVVHSLIRCETIVKSFHPDVVVGVGGYASGPLVRVAARMNIPTVLQEQNSYPGMTNKLLAKKAQKICVAYPGMEKYFPKEKIILTGNPMRSQLGKMITRSEAASMFGLDPGKKTILAFGGSLGARTINETIRQSHDLIAGRDDIQVLWQIGKLYAADFLDSSAARLGNVKAFVFIDRMDMAYAIADVVIARAGAITISELCLTGKAAILVPSPYVAEDHQTHNARSLVHLGAAVLIPDAEAVDTAMAEGLRLLDHPDEIRSLEINIRQLGRPNAADDVAEIIIQSAQSRLKS